MTNKKSRFSEKLKKFAKKMRQTQKTTKISADKFKTPTPAATAPAKPKVKGIQTIGLKTEEFIEKRVVIKEPKEVKEPVKKAPTKKAPKKAPKAAPKETPTPKKAIGETELQNKYKAETGKNAIWRGQETKAYTEWKQKNLDK